MDRKRTLYIFLTLCLLAAVAHARVFLRWGASGDPRKLIKSSGGIHAYSTDVVLNGGSGEMSVYNMLDDMSSVIKSFKRYLNFDELSWNGGNMAIGSVSSGAMQCRLVITSFEGSAETLIYVIEQTKEDAELSGKQPRKHMIKEVPAFPSSTPEFFMKDKNTEMEVAVASTNADKSDVYQFYNISLKASGWSSAIFSAKSSAPGAQSLKLYLKGSSMCCLYVNDSDKKGSNKITLLHKKPAIK